MKLKVFSIKTNSSFLLTRTFAASFTVSRIASHLKRVRASYKRARIVDTDNYVRYVSKNMSNVVVQCLIFVSLWIPNYISNMVFPLCLNLVI